MPARHRQHCNACRLQACEEVVGDRLEHRLALSRRLGLCAIRDRVVDDDDVRRLARCARADTSSAHTAASDRAPFALRVFVCAEFDSCANDEAPNRARERPREHVVVTADYNPDRRILDDEVRGPSDRGKLGLAMPNRDFETDTRAVCQVVERSRDEA